MITPRSEGHAHSGGMSHDEAVMGSPDTLDAARELSRRIWAAYPHVHHHRVAVVPSRGWPSDEAVVLFKFLLRRGAADADEE